jgi:serine/threonine protein kinase
MLLLRTLTNLPKTNILVNNQGQACLADFGCSLALERSGFTSVRGGTLRHMAPELIIDDLRASFASDTWAFAHTVTEVGHRISLEGLMFNYPVCLQIFSGRLPFFKVQTEGAVLLKVANGGLPQRQDYCREISDNVWCILLKCWNFDPAGRPSMQDLPVQFNAIAAARL